ncbi:polymorphic toxin-type HINT domain-containing protein [Streptomyces sp. NPDC058619]|uniref:polymorphic toxin-type HINT domain-containing protein n=1 Tax=unclassified Streptomyces TaxID=2593676 RepID=UPI0036508E6A
MSPFSANFRLPGNRKARPKRARLAGQVGITLSVVLVASLLPVQAWAAPPGGRSGIQLPDLQKDLKAKLDEVAAAKLKGWAGTAPLPPGAYEPKQKTPQEGAGTVNLQPAAGDALVPVGSLPVSIGKAKGSDTAPSGTWSVSMEARAATEDADIDGALIKITPPAGGATPVDVALDYAKFKDLYGTEWATRLKLKQLPVCFLEKPLRDECTVSTDIPNTADPSGKKIRATVDPAASQDPGMRTMSGAGGGSFLLAASDGGAGAGGSYKATSLSPSGTWTAGSSGGGFSWTYPLTVPPAAAGPTPSIAFSYSSQAVDGKTSATNGQASWVGDGWDYNPGFIERRYRSCAADVKANPKKPNNDNAKDKKKEDLCWAGDNLALSLGGNTTELVHDTASGKWIPTSDDGSKVERKTGGANGAKDGEYWIVTTRDGMRYHYGRHNVGTHGDGTSPQTVTNSVFSVPVFGNHPDDPCYKPAYADSSCKQAWRWNLDYVEDIHGNAMVIDWHREENRYARNEKYGEKDSDKVGYVRGGYPLRILYGLRADNLAGAPAGRVDFGVEERCFEDRDTKCGDAQFGSKNAGDKRGWWDTPTTLHCKADAAKCYVSSPTFWSRKRLAAVTTYGQRTEGSTALSKVDQWSLKQSLPAHRTDTHPPLWLESITRTGYGAKDGATGVSMPAVSFLANAIDMPNRVAKSADEDAPDFDRLRVETIRTETGGEIYIDYSAPCPVGATRPKPEENTTRCFPSRWSADSGLEPEKVPVEWFNKYVVESVVEKDRVARQPDVTTTYTYEGDAAWAKDTDEFTKSDLRTYNQWRGYVSVLTKRGVTANAGKPDSTEQSQTRTRYFRGMSGDAGRAKITVKDSTGTEDLGEDLLQHQGQAAETITYSKTGGSIVSRVLTVPWSERTAVRARTDTTNLEAFRRGTSRTDEIQNVSGGKSRMVRTRTTYDSDDATDSVNYGLPFATQIETLTHDGTKWVEVEQACAKPIYVHNTDKNLIGLPQQNRKTAGDCSKTATGTVLADERISYDAPAAFGTAPTRGLPYQVDTLDAAGTAWVTTTRTEYDALGRAVKTYDGAGNPSASAFSPETGPPFSVTSTNALGHTVTTKLDPARGSVLETTDANGGKATTAYDELGRRTEVRTASQKATDKAAYTFEYQISELKTPVVISRALKDNGTYSTSLTIYDGLLRPRQSQAEALGGGRIVTDTLYSANGTVRQTNSGYLAEGTPDTGIFVPKSMTEVHNSTQTAYDGLGRALRTTTLFEGVPIQSATTQYGGDWTLARTGMSANGSAPLPGSRAVKTTTDVQNRTSLVEHYTSTTVDADKVEDPTTTKTRYSYDVRGNLAKVTDAAGNNWTYAYDARGRMTSSDDPDMGRSTFTYDNLDQQVSTTNSLNRSQVTKYDALGRKTALHADTADGALISAWTYDTLPKGKGLPVASTRYTGGANGTAYTSEVTGYDTEGRPTGSKITIPDVGATKGLAGTYAYSTTYTPTGKVQSTTLPSTPGGLAAEKLITRYNADGLPQTMSGLDWYTADTIYSPSGQVLRTATGSAPNRMWSSTLYNPNTGRVTEASSHRETPDPLVSALSYTYDAVGNPTSITDTQPGGRVERQCFTHDTMGQLTQAWTGKTAACTAPTLENVDAGPDNDGFWQEYQFDKIGNRTKFINRTLTKGPDGKVAYATDDETSYTYGVTVAGNGTQPPVTTQPHALAKAEETTRKAGTVVNSLSTYTYDATGNTKTRRIDGDTQTLGWDRRNKLVNATSPGIGGVAITGLGGKCLDVEDGKNTDGTPAQLLSCNESKAQQWRITGDTIQALGKCLTAQDARARLATCNGSEEQKFTYNATDKTLYSTAAKACVTVPNNNPAEGNDLHIFTCTSGAAAQQWTFSNLTSYLYDAGDNRLIQETGSARTLYLGDTEITVNKAGQPLDAVRYYTGPGGTTTVRHTDGKKDNHKLSVLVTDHHNTATANVEQAENQKITRRKSDPYGNPRGAQPADWPGNRTFLGTGTDDNTTGLTHIGAREYDPITGRFISVDPIIDITDPLQMNGYTYASGNPITGSDPSGLRSEECGTLYSCNGNTTITASNSSQIDYMPWSHQYMYYESRVGRKAGQQGWNRSTISEQISANFQRRAPRDPYKGYKPRQLSLKNMAGGIGQSFVEVADFALFGSGTLTRPGPFATGYGALMQHLGVDTDSGSYLFGQVVAPMPGGLIKGGIKAGTKGLAKLLTKVFGRCDSFTAGTKVLLADGTSKPIEELTTGEEVTATNPETGETAAKTVTATIFTEDDKKYVDLGIETNNGIATITTTGHHPFWSETDQTWVNADELKPGMTLRTDEGQTAAVVRTRTYQAVNETYNLTVADLHTYYVLAGATPVLVHNCNEAAQAAAGSGRPDGQTVFAGHGGWSLSNGWTRIPEGTSLATYGPKGHTISDFTGFRAEIGDTSLVPVNLYGPGSIVRNLQLSPPTPNLAIHQKSTTVTSKTALSDLLQPGMGTCHWAACLGSKGQ